MRKPSGVSNCTTSQAGSAGGVGSVVLRSAVMPLLRLRTQRPCGWALRFGNPLGLECARADVRLLLGTLGVRRSASSGGVPTPIVADRGRLRKHTGALSAFGPTYPAVGRYWVAAVGRRTELVLAVCAWRPGVAVTLAALAAVTLAALAAVTLAALAVAATALTALVVAITVAVTLALAVTFTHGAETVGAARPIAG